MKEIILLKISLNGSVPPIWRELAVKSCISFAELHHTIQLSMPWANYHLFEFNSEGYRIGYVFDDEIEDGFNTKNLLDADTTLLSDILSDVGETLLYKYDMGDNWEHTIELQAFTDADPSIQYPFCMDGAMACPPDDCLGIHHFNYILDILNDKSHPEYKSIRTYLPKNYNPALFDIRMTNKKLKGIKSYIANWRKKNL